eukprot:CAMPEP_0116931390 /NCGR_PEP_ID=MMETSP0467-20121206/27786_1 /TAXON_ID=283647 /ORGANISM="Mesodinium pulex, Strain SPMC105" /LENGTH=63 /DNA_ID=CAMNT_0004611817 /DNA_START=667 /DNA_END=858 /DNA_ORIENTATION=-
MIIPDGKNIFMVGGMDPEAAIAKIQMNSFNTTHIDKGNQFVGQRVDPILHKTTAIYFVYGFGH